jgi:hypothetical protein
MSGLITFQRGPYQGWRVGLHGTWQDGVLAHTTVEITPPLPHGSEPVRSGLLSFRPGIPGWLESVHAEMQGGPDAMAGLLEWIVEATRQVLAERTDIPADQREFWQGIVDTAGQTRAAFLARYPDGIVPPFEAVAWLGVDPADTTPRVAAHQRPAAPAQAFQPRSLPTAANEQQAPAAVVPPAPGAAGARRTSRAAR